MRYPIFIINCAFSVATSSVATAAPPNFDDHISPIFEQSCNNCHNPDKQKGDLDLTTYSAAMRGGSGGKFAEPGEGADSKMYGVITHTLKPKMPPKGEKLEKKEADLIRAWINGGLLENKSGKPKKKKKPAFALSAAPSSAKPDKIAMPRHLLLEPVVLTARATVVADMATSPWAPLLAVTGQRQVLLYNTSTLQLVGVLPFDHGQPETLSFHPSGKYLLAGGGIAGKAGTTVTWDIESGKEVLHAGKDFDSVIAASLRADLGGVTMGGPGKRVKLWDTAADAELISIKKHTDWVTQLAYSPDGVLLASGGRGGGVYIWEAETGNEFHNLRGHKAAITDMAWRTDSNLLATASEDGSMLIWEMNNGKQVKKVVAHAGGILSLDWTRNGHLVTSGRDMKVKIWKPDFNLHKELPASKDMITRVTFSSDGQRVFAASWSGEITVWEVATAKQAGTLAANPPSITSRIEWIQREITAFPKLLAQAEEGAKTAATGSATAKAALTDMETDHRNSTDQYNQLVAARTQLDSQLKTLIAEGRALGKQRQQKQQELARARDLLNKHNAAIAAMRKQHQQAESEMATMTAHQQQLAAAEQKARKSAEAKPEDAALKQAADKAKAALDTLRQQLAAKRNESRQKSTALAQLSNQQKGPGNQLAVASKGWEDINAKWAAHHAKRKPLQEKRNTIQQSLTETQKLVKSLESRIKSAREAWDKLESKRKKATGALEQTRQKKAALEAGLKHWQAAAINTEAIHLAKEAAQLAATQNENMDAYTALAAEVQQLKDVTKLVGKSRELQQLRNTIDQAAPKVLEKFKQANSRKQEYLNAAK